MIENHTYRLLRDKWGQMSLPSLLRYRDFLLRKESGRLRAGQLLRLHMYGDCPGDIWLRECGSDYGNYCEVLLEKVYGSVVNKIKSCDYIIDLGANIGLASRFFAGRYSGCLICAVEPDQGNFQNLERNLAELIIAGRCQTLQNAVWGHSTMVSIEVAEANPEKYDCFYTEEVSQEKRGWHHPSSLRH